MNEANANANAKESKESKKSIFFIIEFENENEIESEELKFDKNYNKDLEVIYQKDEQNENKVECIKVFRLSLIYTKSMKDITLEFELKNNKYSLKFDINENINFVFDSKLEIQDTFFKRGKEIKNAHLKYYDKINLFKEALENISEDDKKKSATMTLLYKDSINLYSKKIIILCY